MDARFYGEAVEAWEKALAVLPKDLPDDAHRDLLNKLGIAHTQRQDYQAAEKAFRSALRIAPGAAKTHFNMGLLFLHQDDLNRAEEWLKATLECASWYPEAHYHLGYIQEKRGAHERAAGEYVKELNENAASANAWYGLMLLKKRGLIAGPRLRPTKEEWSAADVIGLAAALAVGLGVWILGEMVRFRRKRQRLHEAAEAAPEPRAEF